MNGSCNSIFQSHLHQEVLLPILEVCMLEIGMLSVLFFFYCYTRFQLNRLVSWGSWVFLSIVWWSRIHLLFQIDCYRCYGYRLPLSRPNHIRRNYSYHHVTIMKNRSRSSGKSKVVRLSEIPSLTNTKFQYHSLDFKLNTSLLTNTNGNIIAVLRYDWFLE